MTILATLEEVRDAVAALGIRASLSPNDMNPPCALIGAPSPVDATFALNAGSVSLTIPVELIGRGLTVADLEWLYEQLPAVMVAVSATQANATVYRLSDGRELPAYTITLEGTS